MKTENNPRTPYKMSIYISAGVLERIDKTKIAYYRKRAKEILAIAKQMQEQAEYYENLTFKDTRKIK